MLGGVLIFLVLSTAFAAPAPIDDAAAWNFEVDFGSPADQSSVERRSVAAPHFSYDGESGPARWGSLDPSYARCGTGTKQSPINLPSMQNGNPQLLTLHWVDLVSPFSVSNNGHTIQVDVAGNAKGRKNYVTYNGKRYQFIQFHFHGYVRCMNFYFFSSSETASGWSLTSLGPASTMLKSAIFLLRCTACTVQPMAACWWWAFCLPIPTRAPLATRSSTPSRDRYSVNIEWCG